MACYWKELSHLKMWRNAAYSIQTYFGNGFASYLDLLRYFFHVNLLFLITVFICVSFLRSLDKDISVPCSPNITSCNCSLDYLSINNKTVDSESVAKNHSHAMLYPSHVINSFHSIFHLINSEKPIHYSSLLISIIYFIVTFKTVVKLFVQSFREWLIQNEGQLYQFCNIIFTSCDFCITNEKSRDEKKKFIFKEIISLLKKRKISQSQSKPCDRSGKLLLIRVIVNVLVLLLSVTCNIAIYLIYDKRFQYFDPNILPSSYRVPGKIFLDHVPPVTITLFNLTIFRIFQKLTNFEHYSYTNCIRVVIIRTALFKFATIVTFSITLYHHNMCATDFHDCAIQNCNELICFGHYYVDEIYRLVIVYFIFRIIIVFFISYPLLMIDSYNFSLYFKCSNIRQMYCNYEYCLDLIYLQTFCWLAIFHDFTVPGLFCFLYFFLFYINKFECLSKFKIMNTEECTLKMSSIFNVILLMHCLFAVSFFSYIVFNTLPLYTCLLSGKPISNLEIGTLALVIFRFVGIVTECSVYKIITIAVIIVLLVINYCYKVTCIANRNMVSVLKNQLLLEGYDKQFLLDRLSLLLKQHTENVS